MKNCFINFSRFDLVKDCTVFSDFNVVHLWELKNVIKSNTTAQHWHKNNNICIFYNSFLFRPWLTNKERKTVPIFKCVLLVHDCSSLHYSLWSPFHVPTFLSVGFITYSAITITLWSKVFLLFFLPPHSHTLSFFSYFPQHILSSPLVMFHLSSSPLSCSTPLHFLHFPPIALSLSNSVNVRRSLQQAVLLRDFSVM